MIPPHSFVVDGSVVKLFAETANANGTSCFMSSKLLQNLQTKKVIGYSRQNPAVNCGSNVLENGWSLFGRMTLSWKSGSWMLRRFFPDSQSQLRLKTLSLVPFEEFFRRTLRSFFRQNFKWASVVRVIISSVREFFFDSAAHLDF